jgi:hypothetical protein
MRFNNEVTFSVIMSNFVYNLLYFQLTTSSDTLV